MSQHNPCIVTARPKPRAPALAEAVLVDNTTVADRHCLCTCADGCEPGKPFTKPSTWADILGREEARVMRLMLALRPDGHMFHQVTGLSDVSSRQPRAECCSCVLATLVRVALHR